MPAPTCHARAPEASAPQSVAPLNRLGLHPGLPLTIVNVAAMFGVSPWWLNYLEWRGVVRRRRDGRAWVYSWFDCERIALIVKARRAGLALGRITAIVAAMDEDSSTAVCESGQVQCAELIVDLDRREKLAAEVVTELRRIEWELCERIGLPE